MITKKQSYAIIVLSIFYISLLFITLPTKSVNAIDVTPNTRVGMKDVVVVNYTLWVESVREDDQEGTVYVVDPDQPVPNSIIEDYPTIKVPPNVGFREEMIGMRAGDNKSVDIPENSEKGFTNVSDPFYGKKLSYTIRIKEILYDSSSPPFTLIDIPFFIPFLILVAFILFILVILRIQRVRQSHHLFMTKKECYGCNKSTATVKCGNSGCNTLYCKECFLEGGCELCHSNTMVPLKKRE